MNRHDLPAVTLQAICDANKRFLDVFTGTPSKIHDARVFSMSFISQKLPGLCGDEYHLLGDSAYPLRQYLITPYRDYGTLTEQQIKFNKRFSATRVKIENSFALLKQRWRQLTNLDFFEVDRLTNFIIACCVLHNLCISDNDEWHISDDTTINADDVTEEVESNLSLRRLGEEKRNNIVEMLN